MNSQLDWFHINPIQYFHLDCLQDELTFIYFIVINWIKKKSNLNHATKQSIRLIQH